MSKRDKGALIEEYEQRSFMPDAVRNYICLLGWNPKDDQEKMPIETIIERFDFDGVNKGNARFDETKLSALNAEYIRELAISDLAQYALPILESNGIDIASIEQPYLLKVLELCQTKIKALETLLSISTIFSKIPMSLMLRVCNEFIKVLTPKYCLTKSCLSLKALKCIQKMN